MKNQLILPPENLQIHQDIIIHLKFWQSSIKLINISTLAKDKAISIIKGDCVEIRNKYTNYKQLSQSIKTVKSYQENWRIILENIVKYQTTIQALEWQHINNFKFINLSSDNDIIARKLEQSRILIDNLNQLLSKIQELELILLTTIKLIYFLGEQENYSGLKVFKICQSFCKISLSEYREIIKQIKQEPEKNFSFKFINIRNQVWQNFEKTQDLWQQNFNQALSNKTQENFTSIKNIDELKNYLRKEFFYCDCVQGTVTFLKTILKLMNNLQENEIKSVRQKKIQELQQQWQSHPILFTWFIFNLEEKGLIYHGFNITDCWLTDKGTEFLKILDNFAEIDF